MTPRRRVFLIGASGTIGRATAAALVALAAATASDVTQMVLLSAICVQKPLLAFQRAKLAFEGELVASGLPCSIVRPTAYVKSLSGQVARVQQGKPCLVFGDERLTACKPVSDGDLGRDLARYLARCLEDAALHNRILPIGGPGGAITPHDQGRALFAMLGRAPKFRRVPVAMLVAISVAQVVRTRPLRTAITLPTSCIRLTGQAASRVPGSSA